jgi:hypothetical protein
MVIRKLVGRNFFPLDGPHSPRAGLAGRPEKYEYPPIQDSSRSSMDGHRIGLKQIRRIAELVDVGAAATEVEYVSNSRRNSP